MNGILKKDLRVVLTGVMIFISYQVYSNPESGTKEQGDVYRNLPFSMPEVSQPSFPDYEVNIRDFGALSDGVTLNTEAINNAIKAVSSKGGGKVIIPEGLWLTGPVVLLSNVNLYVEKNALIVFSSDTSLYPIIDTSFEGLETKRCQSPISAMNAENIAITGNGVFDGAGDRWRPVKKDKMTERQWKNLVSSGGKVDENGKVWYPDAGALKASVLEYSKEQTDSAGRGDFQELTGLVYPSFVLRIFDFERCEGVQSLVFAKWRCAGCGVV